MAILRAGTLLSRPRTTGASIWGATEVDALKNIDSVVHMIVESMLEHGEPLPEEPADQAEVTVDPRVAVTV